MVSAWHINLKFQTKLTVLVEETYMKFTPNLQVKPATIPGNLILIPPLLKAENTVPTSMVRDFLISV